MTESTTQAETAFEGWFILELMGHRRLAGYVKEQTVAGSGFLRLDVPQVGDNQAFTQFYPASAVYCMTPTTEAVARAIAERVSAAPVSRYELPMQAATVGSSSRPEYDDDMDNKPSYDDGDE